MNALYNILRLVGGFALVTTLWSAPALAQYNDQEEIEDFSFADGLDDSTPVDSINEVAPDGGEDPYGDSYDDGLSSEFNNDYDDLPNEAPSNPVSAEPTTEDLSTPEPAAPPPTAAPPAAAPPVNQAPIADPANAEALMDEAASTYDSPAAAPAPPPADTAPLAAGEALPIEAPPVETGPMTMGANEFSGTPPLPGSIRQMADGEAPEEYIVEYGDTLFDICDQLLDEPGYWPKLWAMNPDIKNPHFIYPGTKLSFYPGDDETPPYLQVVAEDDVIPIDKGDLDETELVQDPVQLVDETSNELPIEVVGPQELPDSAALEATFIEGGGRFSANTYRITVPGFLYTNEKEGKGYVMIGRREGVSIDPDREAIIENTGGLSVGGTYSVLRDQGELEIRTTGDSAGYYYTYVGSVKITRDAGEGFVVAKLIDEQYTLRPEDILVDYVSVARVVSVSPNLNAAQDAGVEVVASGLSSNSLISGQGGMVVLGGGSVSRGSFLRIYDSTRQLTENIFDESLPVDPVPSAVVEVIDSTDAGGIGYVHYSGVEVRVGNRADRG